jgi:hypothetical protein
MIWFTRIDSFLDHALTALAALPRVRQSPFSGRVSREYRGRAPHFLTGKPNWLNGLAQRAGLTGKPDWAFFDLGLVWHIILLPAHHRVLAPLWRGN